jgi:hypothetical protein
VPTYSTGDLELSGEVSLIDYNTNWQNWDMGPDGDMQTTMFPTNESNAGIASFRNAYAPFQDRETKIYLVKANYYLDVWDGIEVFGKWKMIDDQDKRMNDSQYLPYNTDGSVNNANTAGFYGNPGTAGQWKQFDDLADDDKDMDYMMWQLGASKQLTDELNMGVTYEFYDVELVDGNTAFQGYNVQEMASGKHKKNKLMISGKYLVGGAEFGLAYGFAWGTFVPDYGDGYVPQTISDARAEQLGLPKGSMGFEGRFGGWNSLIRREYYHQHMKAYMKLLF